MAVKLFDLDIRHIIRIEGLTDYDAVEILFKNGRDPIGRARIPCNGDFLEPERIYPYCADLQESVPLEPPDGPLPTVTVAICTRNRPEELVSALHSLFRQEYPADEVLVIDNGCQHQVRSLVTNIRPTVRYLPERRRGLDFARNCAISEATGEIIAFMDDDTAADPFWVRSLAESFAAFPQAGAVTGLTLPLKLETEAQAMFEAYGGFARGFARRVLPCDDQRILGRRLPLIAEAIGVGSGCNMAFRSAVLRELNGFDEALDTGAPLPGGGDLDIFYRVLRAGYQFLYEPRAIIRHRHRRSKTGLRRQLAGHYRSVSAFLVKTFGSERGFARISVASFLAWRIAKNGYRLIRSLAGRDVLPITFNAHIFAAGLAGLGSYHASKWRIRGQTG